VSEDQTPGTVVEITDPDEDVDDYGLPVFFPPRVTVRFDDGVEDTFGTSSWGSDRYSCGDLIRLEDSPAPKFTIKKYEGDDAYSWAVFKDGVPVVTGCSRTEASYHRNRLKEAIVKKS